MPRGVVLAGGVVIYAVVYVGFALADAPWEISPLFALYGLFFAATDGVLKAWVADHVEGPLAGTAYGIYAGLVGAALLLASALGGVLWTSVGREATFWAGAAFAVASLPLVAIASGIGRPPRSR